MSLSAVDANCICHFQRESIVGEPGLYHQAIERLLQDGQLVLDEGGLCRQEWLDTASGPIQLNLNDWINDLIANNQLSLAAITPVGRHRKQLSSLGVPKKDHKWFALCRDSTAATFLTEDIDFYDPREKLAGDGRRRRVMLSGSGPVKRFFRAEAGTEVTCCEHLCAR